MNSDKPVPSGAATDSVEYKKPQNEMQYWRELVTTLKDKENYDDEVSNNDVFGIFSQVTVGAPLYGLSALSLVSPFYRTPAITRINFIIARN